MNRPLPTLAILLGVLLLLPFLGFGLGALRATANEPRMLGMLMYWSAVMLAFFGAVHWGIALVAEPPVPAPTRTERWRLSLGLAPAAIGWAAVAIPLYAPPDIGLALLIAGYIAVIVVEDQGRRGALVPRGYGWLRWVQTVVIVGLLVTVLVVRLLGARIVF